MKYLIPILCLFMMSCSTLVLKTESVFIKGQLAQSQEYYLTGNIKEEVIFEAGKIFILKEFHKDGQLKNLFNVKEKTFIEYNKDGTIKEEGEIDNTTLGFLALAGLTNLSSLTSLAIIPEGNGIIKEYYNNGKIKEEVSYKDGKLNGIFKEYYENGSLKSEGRFKNGFLDGKVKEYYAN